MSVIEHGSYNYVDSHSHQALLTVSEIFVVHPTNWTSAAQGLF